MYDDSVRHLSGILKNSKSTVFFGGAGVSTESGIPDFRSASGIYNKDYFGLSAEGIVSHDFFFEHTELFYKFYFEKMVFEDAKPNSAHKALTLLEKKGMLDCVITQNIDGLHQLAGSRKVIELHGTVHENHCLDCNKQYGLEAMLSSRGVPRCAECGGIIKPDVVLYGEGLDIGKTYEAKEYILKADTLIIGGTSLAVYPAASYIEYFSGRNIVLINYSETPADSIAIIVIHDSIGKVLSDVVELINI